MKLPFDAAQFFGVFARYNAAVWPAQLVLTGVAVFAVALAVRPRSWSDRVVSMSLAGLWIWMGVVYHLGFFRPINPAAIAFGAVFVFEGIAFGVAGRYGGLRFRLPRSGAGVVGGLLIAYALVIYPLLAVALGHRYPETPTFGLPCPTTIFTLGLLWWTDSRPPLAVLVIPLVWSVVGASAALQLGVWEDLGLVVAGAVTLPRLFTPRRIAAATRS